MKLGIAGTGKIAGEALYAIQPIRNITVSAVFARPSSRDKGERLAARYSIPAVYTDYDEMLDRSDIDTVYIGLVNSVHYEYAKRALEKRKHVILEKPFTGTLEEAESLVRLARAQGCFVLEAITVLHNDVIGRMKAVLPRLGKIRIMQANYSQYSSRYDRYLAGEADHTFDPAYLGGALRDLNIYNIHYAAALFGMPEHARYYANTGYNGIDTSGTLIMEYDGFYAVCTGAKDSDSPCFVVVQGEKGYMRIDGKPNVAPNLTTVIADETRGGPALDASGAVVRTAREETFIPDKPHHRMTREFQDFARMIDHRETAAADEYMKESAEVMKILSLAVAT